MSQLLLVIGNRNYSSWSLRAWLTLKFSGLSFRVRRLPMFTTTFRQEIAQLSPTGKVPVLFDGDLVIWESIAICEYIAECAPAAQLWPQERAERAMARSIAAEIHAGFPVMRRLLPMNCRSFLPLASIPENLKSEVNRVLSIWRRCRERSENQGELLFGHFSVADAMFAPIVTRFATYNIPLDEVGSAYSKAVLRLPPMVEWLKEAKREKEVIEELEIAHERLRATEHDGT